MRNWISFFPIGVFAVYLAKILVIPATFPDSIVIIALISYIVLDHIRLTQPTMRKYEENLKILSEKLEKLDENQKNVQAGVNSLKLSVGMRSVNSKQS